MKLTKGKLSKIYNKKKQTMRKFKTKSKSSNKKGRGKTFRKKRPLNLNKKTLKNAQQIQMRNGRTMAGGDPTNDNDENKKLLAAAKQRISSAEESLDDQMEQGPSSPVQAEPVDDLKKEVSVEAQPFSSSDSSSSSSSSSASNFDAVAQGLKEYIDHTVAVALASSSSSSEDMQNPVSSVSTAVETTKEGIRNLNSSPSSSLESGELGAPIYAIVEPSAPPAEEEEELDNVSVGPSAPPLEEEGEEP